jgi:hypothetical protein
MDNPEDEDYICDTNDKDLRPTKPRKLPPKHLDEDLGDPVTMEPCIQGFVDNKWRGTIQSSQSSLESVPAAEYQE